MNDLAQQLADELYAEWERRGIAGRKLVPISRRRYKKPFGPSGTYSRDYALRLAESLADSLDARQ